MTHPVRAAIHIHRSTAERRVFSTVRVRRAVLVAFACVVGLVQASVQVQPARSGLVHVRVAGPLDSAHVGAAIIREIERAASEGKAGVALEFGANEARLDVVWAIARAIVDSPVPVGVLLRDDEDRAAGWNLMLLGLTSPVCAGAPGLRVRCEPGDDLAHLAPADLDAEKMERELRALVWEGLRRRGIDPAFAVALVDRSSMIVIETHENGARLSSDEHAGEPLLRVSAAGVARADVSAGLLQSAGLLDAEVRDARSLIDGWRGEGGTKTVKIESGLAEARDEVGRELPRIDQALDAIEEAIRRAARPIDDRAVPRSVLEQAAAQALRDLDGVTKRLVTLEARFDDYPELLRFPAPEGTPVARDEERNIWDWRRAFLERRGRIDDLTDDARRLRR